MKAIFNLQGILAAISIALCLNFCFLTQAQAAQLKEQKSEYFVADTNTCYFFFRQNASIKTKDIVSHSKGRISAAKGSLLSRKDDKLCLEKGNLVVNTSNQQLAITLCGLTVIAPAGCQLCLSVQGKDSIVIDHRNCKDTKAVKVIAQNKGDLEKKEFLLQRGKVLLHHHNQTQTTELEQLETQIASLPQLKKNEIYWFTCAKGSRLSIDQGHFLNHQRGWFFINLPAKENLNTNYLSLHNQNNCLINLQILPDYERLGNCHSQGKLSIISANTVIPLACGHEITISPKQLNDSTFSSFDGTLRRDVKRSLLKNNFYATVSDFNLVSLISNAEHLKSICKPQHKHMQIAKNNLIKTHAAILQATSSHGNYAHHPIVSGANGEVLSAMLTF